MAQQVKKSTCTHENMVPSLASGVAASCCAGCRCGSDLALLWLWYRSQMWFKSGVAVAVEQASSCSSNLTPSLGISICHRCSPKKRKKERKKKKKQSLILTFISASDFAEYTKLFLTSTFITKSKKQQMLHYKIEVPNDTDLNTHTLHTHTPYTYTSDLIITAL